MDSIRLNSSTSSTESNSSPIYDVPSRIGSRRRSSRSTTCTSTQRLDDKLHQIKRRTIAKPRRLDPSTLATDSSEVLIKKLYTNKKMTKLKPTNLETIFEEPKEHRKHGVMFVSAQKFRRAIHFKDHLNISKQTVQHRRKRIKRLLGSGNKLKKMTMDAFMSHLTEMHKVNEDDIDD